ncbi:MAG: hypothetical protein ABI847_10275, partial [Anaerolineales bacterium]
ALPLGVAVEAQSATTTSAQAVVSAATSATLTFNIFDFPGWRATVDGQTTGIIPSVPNGLITLPVPAGRHTVEVTFGSTRPRSLGAGISLGTLAALGLLAGLSLRTGHASAPIPFPSPVEKRHRGREKDAKRLRQERIMRTAWPAPFSLTLTALGLLIVRGLIIDGRDTLLNRSRFDGERVAGVGQSLDINFDDQLVLVGVDAPGAAVAADAKLAVTLYWRTQNAPAADYSTTVQVLDEAGNIWGQADSQNPGRLPTTRWATGQYGRDEHRLRLVPGTPPGTYRLTAGVYAYGGAGLSVLDDARAPQGQIAELGTLTVTRGDWSAARPAAVVPAELPLGPVAWLGVTPSTLTPQAGDELRLAWFWRGEGGAAADLSLHLALRASDGALIQTWDGPLARPDYPISAWSTGELVRGVTTIRIPASAPAGSAQLEFSLRTAAGRDIAEAVQAALFDIRVPDRTFDIPPLAHTLNANFGGLVRLVGYDADRAAGRVTIVWQAARAMDSSYQVFVHALDAGGQIIAQADAVPAGGRRPTTGWLPGEVVVDPYSLPLQNADALEVGLVDPLTRQRLGVVRIELP